MGVPNSSLQSFAKAK